MSTQTHAVLGLLMFACGCSQAPQPVSQKPPPTKPVASALAGSWIDLSHPYDEQTIYWPTEKGFDFERGDNRVTAKGYYYAANRFRTAEHGGTHIDAPIHFSAEGLTVDKIPLERLIGPAVVIDVSDKCQANPDYQISIADLRAWEEQHEQQLVDVIVLLKTGYARHWPDREKYLGTTALGPEAVAQLHFPGLDPEAAKWLVEHRAPKAVGIDTASIDFGQSTHFETHQTLFQHQVPAFENLADLAQLPAQGTTIVALPMKIAGGSGGPLRIVALKP